MLRLVGFVVIFLARRYEGGTGGYSFSRVCDVADASKETVGRSAICEPAVWEFLYVAGYKYSSGGGSGSLLETARRLLKDQDGSCSPAVVSVALIRFSRLCAGCPPGTMCDSKREANRVCSIPLTGRRCRKLYYVSWYPVVGFDASIHSLLSFTYFFFGPPAVQVPIALWSARRSTLAFDLLESVRRCCRNNMRPCCTLDTHGCAWQIIMYRTWQILYRHYIYRTNGKFRLLRPRKEPGEIAPPLSARRNAPLRPCI